VHDDNVSDSITLSEMSLVGLVGSDILLTYCPLPAEMNEIIHMLMQKIAAVGGLIGIARSIDLLIPVLLYYRTTSISGLCTNW
jgi:hypothetical protein